MRTYVKTKHYMHVKLKVKRRLGCDVCGLGSLDPVADEEHVAEHPQELPGVEAHLEVPGCGVAAPFLDEGVEVVARGLARLGQLASRWERHRNIKQGSH